MSAISRLAFRPRDLFYGEWLGVSLRNDEENKGAGFACLAGLRIGALLRRSHESLHTSSIQQSNFQLYILSTHHRLDSHLHKRLCYCEVRRFMKCSEPRVKPRLARQSRFSARYYNPSR